MPHTLVVTVPAPGLANDLDPLPDGVDVLVWTMEGPPPRDHLDIVVTPHKSAERALPLLAGVDVSLVQGQSIGWEHVVSHLPAGLTFANAASVHETATSEMAVALTLASQRSIPEFARAQISERWTSAYTEGLADRRVLLLGYGGVGKAVAARLAGFEVDLVRVASHAREEDGVRVHGVDELPQLLPGAEIVILALPGGDATRHIIGEKELTALPDGALVVNVGRGQLIDTDALVAHVERGRIRAALDVTDPEPLTPGHPLWTMPGVLISPHVGGASAAMRPRMAALVRRQIELMLRGEPPLNVVIRPER